MSQIDMVVWRAGTSQLQVCGSLEIGEGNAPAPDGAEFLVVVRQDGNVAGVRGTHAAGRWEFRETAAPGVQFRAGEEALVSAVVILKHEPAGLKTISWVQPVTIEAERQADGEEELHFTPVGVDPPTGGELPAQHSISSSFAVFKDGAGGGTYRWEQRVERVPLATHHPAP